MLYKTVICYTKLLYVIQNYKQFYTIILQLHGCSVNPAKLESPPETSGIRPPQSAPGGSRFWFAVSHTGWFFIISFWYGGGIMKTLVFARCGFPVGNPRRRKVSTPPGALDFRATSCPCRGPGRSLCSQPHLP